MRDAESADFERTLEASLRPVLSSRRTLPPLLAAFGRLEADAQRFIASWTAVVANTSPELAWRFCQSAPDVLQHLDGQRAEQWISAALDVHDARGLGAACGAIENWHRYTSARVAAAVWLSEVSRTLRHVLRALSTQQTDIAPGPHACIHGNTMVLPERMDRGSSRAENFLHYKATLLLLWAQTRFGTFDVDLGAEFGRYPDFERAADIFNALELVRLEQRLGRLFPGLRRDLALFRGTAVEPLPFARLYAPDSQVRDTLDALAVCYPDLPSLRSPYLLTIDRAALTRRAHRATAGHKCGDSSALRLEHDTEATHAGRIPSNERNGQTAEAGYAFTRSSEAPQATGDEPPVPTAHEYDEWDFLRGRYRRRWCTVREVVNDQRAPDLAEAIIARRAGTIRALKRQFENLVRCDVTQRRQPDGDEVDTDAYIDAWVAIRRGEALSPLAYTRRAPAGRELAVMIMVDMSGSTQGWINEAEREALVVLCEALDEVEERYAIYGFSGLSRQQCETYPLKRFDERYDRRIRDRIAALQPGDYSRMGAAVRHLSRRLDEVDARTRLLLVLSDGRPDDYSDGYRGDYAIEDTCRALNEARAAGVHTFCITLDRAAREYLPRLYGRSAWTVVHDVGTLPDRLGSVYRRLAC